MKKITTLTLLLVSTFFWNSQWFSQAHGSDEPILLKVENHRWSPDVIKVKAGERFKLKITNADPTSEEFESKSLVIEKFMGPKRSITITLGPLKPGEYDYFGCFHPDTAKGKIIAE